MLGDKIKELSKKIKLNKKDGDGKNETQDKIKTIKDWENNKSSTNLWTRLYLMKEFRNKFAHNVLEYNSTNKQVYIKAEQITEDLNSHVLHASEVLVDLYILLINLREPKMKNWKKMITL
jgi:hypothetical protein